ncbi:arsenical pump-driving ATPase [Agrilactobacillus composti DSM 18527 = JCM 14202]|nr:arsenical pump-driving ATPase [Agrilactobacillus composti DSM 18527 = JCM 14202]
MNTYQPLKEALTHYLFFTGKGGVGKTTVASATAIQLADAGQQVMLVSTDPASNLQDVFETSLSNHPKAIPGVPGLFAANFDPVTAAAAYRESVIGLSGDFTGFSPAKYGGTIIRVLYGGDCGL